MFSTMALFPILLSGFSDYKQKGPKEGITLLRASWNPSKWEPSVAELSVRPEAHTTYLCRPRLCTLFTYFYHILQKCKWLDSTGFNGKPGPRRGPGRPNRLLSLWAPLTELCPWEEVFQGWRGSQVSIYPWS